jgi:hypothetical protein
MSKLFIDYKVTTWNRIELDEKDKDIVLQLLEENKDVIDNGDDLIQLLWDNQSKLSKNRDISSDTLLDVTESMSLKDNENCSTVELHEEGYLIWENSKK